MVRYDENLPGVWRHIGKHRKSGERMTGLWRELRGAKVELIPTMCKDIYQDRNTGGGITSVGR